MSIAKWLAALSFAVLVGCGSSGNKEEQPVCTDQSCTPANACHRGHYDCNNAACVDTGEAVVDGTVCGNGLVCRAGACVSDQPVCVADRACQPENPCTNGKTWCPSPTAAASCMVTDNKPDGTACAGTKVCNGGACVERTTCTEEPCTPAAPCKKGWVTCSSPTSAGTCLEVGNVDDGSSCGSALVCLSGACIPACVESAACDTGNVCTEGHTSCASPTAHPACVPANKPEGTPCGTGRVCHAGTCVQTQAPIIEAFTATPSNMAPGASATLSWSVSGAQSLSIDQGVGPVSGTARTVSPSATTTYTLTAQNAAGTAQRSVTVTVSSVSRVWIDNYTVLVGHDVTIVGHVEVASGSPGLDLDWTVEPSGAGSLNPVRGTSTVYTAPIQPGTYRVYGTSVWDRTKRDYAVVTVTPADAVAPTVVERSPAPDATDVPVRAPIAVRFSEPIDPATIAGDGVQVTDRDGVRLACTVTLSTDGMRLDVVPIVTPAAPAILTVALSSAIKDLAGNALAYTSWHFEMPAWISYPSLGTFLFMSPADDFRLTATRSGSPALVFHRTPASNLMFIWDDAQWSAPAEVPYGHFAFDSSDTLHELWLDDPTAAETLVRETRWSGGTRQDDVVATVTTAFVNRSAIVIDGSDRPVVAWDTGTQDETTLTTIIDVARLQGGTWSRLTPVVHTRGTGSSLQWTLAIDATGSPIIALVDDAELNIVRYDGQQWVRGLRADHEITTWPWMGDALVSSLGAWYLYWTFPAPYEFHAQELRPSGVGPLDLGTVVTAPHPGPSAIAVSRNGRPVVVWIESRLLCGKTWTGTYWKALASDGACQGIPTDAPAGLSVTPLARDGDPEAQRIIVSVAEVISEYNYRVYVAYYND